MANDIVMLIPGRTLPDPKKSGIHNKEAIIVSKERDQIAICTLEQHGTIIDRRDSSCELICDPSNLNGMGPAASC